jgi:hypothetical protein
MLPLLPARARGGGGGGGGGGRKPNKSPSKAPVKPFVPPSRSNYYLYKGKYYSTLGDVSLNGASYCQSTYYKVPTDWDLASEKADSLDVITANTWSTTTVVVKAGNNSMKGIGYYSKSYWGLRNYAVSNFLLYKNGINGSSYNCAPCNCQILLLYTGYVPSSSSSSSLETPSILVICLIVVFSSLGCLATGYKFYRLRYPSTSPTPCQVQPTPVSAILAQESMQVQVHPQPMDYGNKSHTVAYPGYIQLQQLPYAEGQQQIPVHGYVQQPHFEGQQQMHSFVHHPQYIHSHLEGQPQPQIHGYPQPHHQEGQPQVQVHGYVQPQLQGQFHGQVHPQVGSYSSDYFYCVYFMV